MADADATITAEHAHARSLLSPKELEILDEKDDTVTDEADDEEVEIVDMAKESPPEDEGDDADDGEDDDAEAQADDEPAEAAAETGDDDAGATDDETPTVPGGFDAVPVLSFVLPEDFESRQEALDAKLSELDGKFEEGDLSRTEYSAESRKLSREQAELDRMHTRAELAKDSYDRELADYQRRVQTTWNSSMAEFQKWAASAEGGGMKYDDNEALLQVLGKAADKIIDKNPNMAPATVWREAHKAVRESLGLPAVAPAPAPAPKVDTKAAKAAVKAARKPDTSAVPQTLAGVGGEAGADPVGSRFAQLDKLMAAGKTIEAEAMLGRMPEADREAWLASA